MKSLITLFCLLAFGAVVDAQLINKSISGYVKDTKNEPVAGATVQLLAVHDSMVMKKGLTNAGGKLQFDNLQDGDYLLVITTTGQQKFTSAAVNIDSLHCNIVLPVIILLPVKHTAMAEVVIKARRPLLVQEIDKTVVNVESMISSASSNTMEVLEKTPGVTVSADGSINLNGRGVLVLIDGRSTYMSGQDLAAYLKSLPGAVLDKIELMDNPPARYDASGNAIINIRLKRNRAGGFTGSGSLGYTQGKYARSNDGLNLNYNYKKLNLFANIGYTAEKNYSTDNYDRKFYNPLNEPVAKTLLVNNQQTRNNGTNTNLGADYAASANSTIGFSLNINQAKRKGWFNYNSENYNAKAQPDSTGTGGTFSGDRRNNFGANLNFTHRFANTGRELTADANYLRYHSNGDQSLQNFVFNPADALISQSSFLYQLPSDINIYTIKADYVQPFKNNLRLEAGVKSSVVDNNSLTDYYNTTNGSTVVDNSQSNHFIYHENINAAYINSQAKWKRLAAQLGLRAENTQATGHQLGNDSVKESRFTKSYTQLFPSVFLSYKLDTGGNNTLTVSLTRRINRPNYQLLNPFLFMRDQYTYTAGNPLLGPQYQYRYEIRYQHKQFFRSGLSYNRFSNIIFQTTDVVNNIFITKPENIAKAYMLLLNTGVSLSPAKWWNLNMDILLSHLGLNGVAYGEKLNTGTNVARINVFNTFQFSKGWAAEAGAYYASRDLNGQAYTSGMFRANVAVQKKIWKDKASIRLSIDDIFHSWIYHNRSFDLKQAQFFQTSEADTRRIGIAFTYRFGRNIFARKSKHNDNASDEEKGRIN